MNVVEPTLQTNWDWRAAGNFNGGGSGSGLMIVSPVAFIAGLPYWPLAFTAMVLVGCGLLFVWAEIGRPWRAINVYFNPQTSWMTRESIVSLPFFAFGLLAVALDFFAFGSEPVRGLAVGVAALIGAGYLYCQTRILFASKGIPAWRHPALKGVIASSGLAEGAGVVVLVGPFVAAPTVTLAVLLVLLVALRGVAWRHYLVRLRADGAPREALKALDDANPGLLWGAHGAPALLALLALLALAFGVGFSAWLLALAGLMTVLGGWWLKFVVITKASFNQGFALPKMPVRGRGPVGPAAKPGWEQGEKA